MEATLVAVIPRRESVGLPLVSVVTPSYNQGEFLETTIQSVLAQDYPFLEYIVVDGGSTDATVSILHRYSERLAAWVSEPDDGQSDAINKGWEMAGGEILAWLNSDDVYEPGTVRRAVEVLMTRPDVAAVYGDCLMIDGGGRVIRRHRAQPFDLLCLLLRGNYISQPTVFLRRSAMEDVGGLATDLHYSMDYELWLRLGLRYRLAYVPEVLARFRQHGATKTTTSQVQIWRERREVIRRVLEHPTCPPRVKDRSDDIWATFHSRAAAALLSIGQVRASIDHLVRVVRYDPSRVFDRTVWFRYIYSGWKHLTRGGAFSRTG